MRSKIQKWGNSLAVRIPHLLSKDAHVALGTAVDLSLVDGKIVIATSSETEYSLDNLLDGITENNLHEGVDTGEAVGREAW